MNKKFLETLDRVNETIKNLEFKNIDDLLNSFFNSQNIKIFCKEIENLQIDRQKEIDNLEEKIKNDMDKTELRNIIDKIQKTERYIGTLEGLCITLEMVEEKRKK